MRSGVRPGLGPAPDQPRITADPYSTQSCAHRAFLSRNVPRLPVTSSISLCIAYAYCETPAPSCYLFVTQRSRGPAMPGPAKATLLTKKQSLINLTKTLWYAPCFSDGTQVDPWTCSSSPAPWSRQSHHREHRSTLRPGPQAAPRCLAPLEPRRLSAQALPRDPVRALRRGLPHAGPDAARRDRRRTPGSAPRGGLPGLRSLCGDLPDRGPQCAWVSNVTRGGTTGPPGHRLLAGSPWGLPSWGPARPLSRWPECGLAARTGRRG
jgi:hypothetical protein